VAVGTLMALAVPAVPAVAVQGVLTLHKEMTQGLLVQAELVSGEMAVAVARLKLDILVLRLGTAALGYRQVSRARQWFAVLVAVPAVSMSLLAWVVRVWAEMARPTTTQPQQRLLTQALGAGAVVIPALVLAETAAQAGLGFVF